MRVAIGSDHAGVVLKGGITEMLRTLGVEHEDHGTFDGHAVDYPDVAATVARAVGQGKFDRGILICGTGIGVSIVANKVRGVRAALCHDPLSARLSREHNDANILCLGSRIIGGDLAAEIVRVWLDTPFSSVDRHERRVRKIHRLDEE